jgi:hypothetical protein
MKVVCLSEDTARPCLLLQYHGAKILLDCALDVKALQAFMPIPLLPDRRLESVPGWAPKVPNGENIGAVSNYFLQTTLHKFHSLDSSNKLSIP